MLKAELHTHTSDDPNDFIPHSATELVDRAAALGYGVLAITLHNKQFDVGEIAAHARDRGVVFIPGVERTICGKHVLLLNFSKAAESVATFEDLGRLKEAQSNGLIIAPHPFYPVSTCLGKYLDRHADLFDAVELNAFYTRLVDFNRPALKWARAHRKPVVGNADVHRLRQLGSTYSLIDAAPDKDAICDAIRAGRVEVRTEPLSSVAAGSILASMVASDFIKKPSDARSRWRVPLMDRR